MSVIHLPPGCDTGKVSDGYHTFDELYEHRCTLFLALLREWRCNAWMSVKHHDGSSMDGWFIAGIDLPTGVVTYHLPMSMWPLAEATGAQLRLSAPAWDGHTSTDVVKRLQEWIKLP